MANSCCVSSTVIASAAKQSRATAWSPWIASSQGLLAMTAIGVIHVPKSTFSILGVTLTEEIPWIESISFSHMGHITDVASKGYPE